jgi:hypothetical protein
MKNVQNLRLQRRGSGHCGRDAEKHPSHAQNIFYICACVHPNANWYAIMRR